MLLDESGVDTAVCVYPRTTDLVCVLATRLLKQGYKYDQLCSYFKRFSNKYKDIFGKFRIEIKQHIKDGIPLPLNTVNRLNRLVTVR